MEQYDNLTAEQKAILLGLRYQSMPSGKAMDELYAAGLVSFDRLWGAYELTAAGLDAAEYLDREPEDDDYDLHSVAANVSIGLAATWQVEAAAEIEALASEEGVTQLSKGLPKQFRNNPRYRDWMDKLMQMSSTGG